MSAILFEILVILGLLLLNGAFAMSELAVMTARRVRLEHRAEKGDAGARAALELAHDPNTFLSTVQIGITLVGTLAGAFGGASLAEELAIPLSRVGWIGDSAESVALGIVVALITYASLILGELVPKRIALGHPEGVASFVARPMRLIARVGSPLVSLLTASTNVVFRLFGIGGAADLDVTEQDIRALVEQGAESGVVHPGEHEIVENTFRLGDRAVSSIMIPRPDMPWIDISLPPDELRDALERCAAPRVLVCDGDVDHVKGVLHAPDVATQCLRGERLDVGALLWEPMFVPETMPALTLIAEFRRTRQRVCVVLDEYGGVQGMASADELLEALVGDLPDGRDQYEPEIRREPNGAWIVDGGVPLEVLENTLDVDPLPTEERRGFRTVGGLAMARLGRVPREGDDFTAAGLRFEVLTMDGRRIGRLRVRDHRGEA